MINPNDSLETLALRRRILQARSALCRLRIQHETRVLRDDFSLVRVGISALRAIPVRSTLPGIALHALPHSRMARMLALAARVLLVARTACLLTGMLPRHAVPPTA